MGPGFSPLDEALALEGGSLTPHAQEGLVRLGAWMPFRQAADLLADLTGVQVSAATGRRATEAAGAAYAAVQTAQAEQIRCELPEAPLGAERQVISADGAFVPLRHGEWAEAKLLVIGAVQQEAGGEVHTRHLSYFARLAEAEAFSQAALVETHRRGLERAQAVCAVLDGAEWLQGFVDEQRPDAVRILDFAHAAGYVSQAGQAVQEAGTPLSPKWLAKQFHALKHDGPPQVLADLRALEEVQPDLKPVQEARGYLEKRAGQMQYPVYQAAGWPIGSGSVESGHKVVMQARLKGPGMRWERGNVNPMLALRTAVCNDRWPEAWCEVTVWQRRQHQQRRQDRVDARLLFQWWCLLGWWVRTRPSAKRQLVPMPRAEHLNTRVTLAAGPPQPRRPAATHPWRRPLLAHRRTQDSSLAKI